MITHNPEAAAVASRILYMRDGRLCGRKRVRGLGRHYRRRQRFNPRENRPRAGKWGKGAV